MPTLVIEPPLAGINRALGFQKLPPFTAIDIMNMWPFNAADGRRVLATRPPLTAYTSPDDNVNLFSFVTAGGEGKLEQGLVAAAEGTLYYWDGEDWVPATGAEADNITTGRPVFATPTGKFVIIANDDELLVYDYSTNDCDILTASAGSVPEDVTVAVTHMGSVMVAGTPGFENVLYSARTGDHTDWDFSQTDEGAAFSTDVEVSGRVNEPIGALVPISADQLVIGCPNSMYVMRGHLSRGGLIDVLSPSLGICGNGAWCIGGDGSMYFMSKSGMGVLAPHATAQPTLISDEKMPDALKGLDYTYANPNISMSYSTRWNCVYIAVTGSQAQAWIYDIRSGGFSRMSFSNYPTVMISYDLLTSFNTCGVLWGGDGYGGLARFDRNGTETDRPFYHAFLGPIQLTDDVTRKAKIKYMRVVLGGDSNDVLGSVVLYTGTDGEDAFTRAFNDLPSRRFGVDHGTLLRNGGSAYPHLAGSALIVVFCGSGDGIATLEHINITLDDAGINRDLRVIGYGYDLSGGIDNYDPQYGGGYNAKFGADGKAKYGKDDADPDDDSNVGPWSDDNTDPYQGGGGGFGPPTLGSGYAAFTLAYTPAASQTDFTHFIPLSLIKQSSFWANVRSDGGDIRVTNSSNVVIPCDILSFNKAGRSGLIAAKLTQSGTAALRVWVGTGETAQPAAGASTGRFNAYDASFKDFWLAGSGTSRTSTGTTFVPAVGIGVINSASGPGGLPGTRYTSDGSGFPSVLAAVTAGTPSAIITYVRRIGPDGSRFQLVNGAASNSLLIFNTSTQVNSNDGMVGGVATTTATPTNIWAQAAALFTSTASRTARMNTGSNTNTTAAVIGTTTTFGFQTDGEDSDVVLSALQLHTSARSAAFVDTQRTMILTPTAFWNAPSFTTLVWPN